MAQKETISQTEEAYQDEMWRGAMTPEQQQRFILARFRDLSTGMAGQNERLNHLAESVNALTQGQEAQGAALQRMEPILERLDAANAAREHADEYRRANTASRFCSEIARILIVLIAASPILISDLRNVWIGDSPLAWYTVLFAALAVFSLLAVVLRRSEDA